MMNTSLKRYLPLILILLGAFIVLQWFGQKKKPYHADTSAFELIPTSSSTYTLKTQISIKNPSSFSAKLGIVKLFFQSEGDTLGDVMFDLKRHISSGDTYRFPLEIRFEKEIISDTLDIQLSGLIESGGWLKVFTLPVDTIQTVLLKRK